ARAAALSHEDHDHESPPSGDQPTEDHESPPSGDQPTAVKASPPLPNRADSWGKLSWNWLRGKLEKTVGKDLLNQIDSSIVGGVPFDVEPSHIPFKEVEKMRSRLKANNTWHSGVNLNTASPEMVRALYSMADLADKNGHKLLITSGNDGKHSRNSAHYSIGAADIRILRKTVNPATGSDEFDAKTELALALKYAVHSGFKSARDERTNGNSPHIHLSMGEQWSDPYNYVLRPAEKALDIIKNLKNGLPPFKGEVMSAIHDQALSNRIPETLAMAVANAESGGDPNAVSPVGAFGVMQLMPETARKLIKGTGWTEADLRRNPRLQVKYGLKYLSQMIDRQRGNIAQGLAAYNAGPGAMDSIAAGKAGIPNETVNYVAKIMSDFDSDYKGLSREQQLDRARNQILGKIPSPNRNDFSGFLKQAQVSRDVSKLQGRAANFFDSLNFVNDTLGVSMSDALKLAPPGIQQAINPNPMAGMRLAIKQLNNLFGYQDGEEDVSRMDAVRRNNSVVFDKLSKFYANVSGMSYDAAKNHLSSLVSKGGEKAGIAGPLLQTLVDYESMTKRILGPLYNMRKTLEEKSGWGKYTGQFQTKNLQDIKMSLDDVGSMAVQAGIMGPTGLIPSVFPVYDRKQEADLDKMEGNFIFSGAKFIERMAPEIASIVGSGGFWKGVFGEATAGFGARIVAGEAGTKAVQVSPGSLLGDLFPKLETTAARLGGPGSALFEGLVSAPAIATDFGLRQGFDYLSRTLIDGTPESKHSDEEQFLNFFKNTLHGGAAGAMMAALPSIAPALLRSAAGVFLPKVVSTGRSLPAFADFLESAEYGKATKVMAGGLSGASWGTGAGAHFGLLADFLQVHASDLFKMGPSSAPSFLTNMGVGALGGGFFAGTVGALAAFMSKNPYVGSTITGLMRSAGMAMEKEVMSVYSKEALEKLKDRSTQPWYETKYNEVKEKLNSLVANVTESVDARGSEIQTLKSSLQNLELRKREAFQREAIIDTNLGLQNSATIVDGVIKSFGPTIETKSTASQALLEKIENFLKTWNIPERAKGNVKSQPSPVVNPAVDPFVQSLLKKSGVELTEKQHHYQGVVENANNNRIRALGQERLNAVLNEQQKRGPSGQGKERADRIREEQQGENRASIEGDLAEMLHAIGESDATASLENKLPQWQAQELFDLKSDEFSYQEAYRSSAEAYRQKPTKDGLAIMNSHRDMHENAVKTRQAYEKDYPQASRYLTNMVAKGLVQKEINSINETQKTLSRVIADSEYVHGATSDMMKSWASAVDDVMKERPDLFERLAEGDHTAFLEAVDEKYRQDMDFRRSLTSSAEDATDGRVTSEYVQHVNDVLKANADSYLTSLMSKDPNTLKTLVETALREQGLEMPEVRRTYFPNQTVNQWMRKTAGSLSVSGMDAVKAVREGSSLNWRKVTGGNDINAHHPLSVVRWLENQFPSVKESSGPDLVKFTEPANIIDLNTISSLMSSTKKGDLVKAEEMVNQAYQYAKMSASMGDYAIPVRGGQIATHIKKEIGFELSAEIDQNLAYENALTKREFNILGDSEFGVTDSHDLFNLSYVADNIERKARKGFVNGATYDIYNGQMRFRDGTQEGLHVPTEEFTRQGLLAIASNLDLSNPGMAPGAIGEAVTQLKLNRLQAETSHLKNLGVIDKGFSPTTSSINLSSVVGEDLDGISALNTLLKEDHLTPEDFGTKKFGNMKQILGERRRSAEVLVDRVLKSGEPHREAILKNFVANTSSSTKVGDIISEFNVDGAEVLMGKQSPSAFLKKYGVGDSEMAAKEYVKALTEANQIANYIARKTGNIDNMFSDYIPDMLYGNYMPESFYTRSSEVGLMQKGNKIGASTRLGTFFEQSEWDYQNPRKFKEQVNKDRDRLLGRLEAYDEAGGVSPHVDLSNLKKFANAPLEERIEILFNKDKEALENVRKNHPDVYNDMIVEAEAMTYAPFMSEASVDPMLLVSKKIKGAANAKNLGDFIQMGTMVTQPGTNGFKMVILSDNTSPPGAGYVPLKGAFSESKFKVSGTDFKGKNVWVSAGFSKAMDDVFGVGHGFVKVLDQSAAGDLRAYKDGVAFSRALALVGGATSFISQMAGKGLALFSNAAYRADQALTGTVKDIANSEYILEHNDLRSMLIKDHAIASGLNLKPVFDMTSAMDEYSLRQLSPAQRDAMYRANLAGAKNTSQKAIKMLGDSVNISNPMAASATRVMWQDHPALRYLMSPLISAGQALTAWDHIQMTNGLSRVVENVSLGAFVNIERSLARSLGPSLEGLSETQKQATVSRVAAAIVNKNMATLPSYLGSDKVTQFLQLVSNTPHIKGSRIQVAVEFLDSFFNVLAQTAGAKRMAKYFKGSTADVVDKVEDPHFFKNLAGGEYGKVTDAHFEAKKAPDPLLRDHYSHFSNELRTVIKEQTQLGLTSLMAQATVVSVVGSWLFSQKDFLGNPPGRTFSIQTGDNEFYSPPDVFGGVKSILRFVDGVYGDSYSSGEPIQAILKNMAESNLNDANPLLRLILDSSARNMSYTYDDLAYDLSEALLGRSINVKQVLGGNRKGRTVDLIDPRKIGTQDRAMAENTNKDQVLLDLMGMNKQADPSERLLKEADLPRKDMKAEMNKKIDAILKNAVDNYEPGSPEWDAAMQEANLYSRFDMADHPNKTVSERFKNLETSQRVIDLRSSIKNRVNMFVNKSERFRRARGPGAEAARMYN
ncbi:MAG: lytic transglycosylase domain-containing protein, partial [Hyphomicrobiaceae bacterium]